jgi:hypothetical protein
MLITPKHLITFYEDGNVRFLFPWLLDQNGIKDPEYAKNFEMKTDKLFKHNDFIGGAVEAYYDNTFSKIVMCTAHGKICVIKKEAEFGEPTEDDWEYFKDLEDEN